MGRNTSLVISHWRHLRCQDRYHCLLSVQAANTPHKFRATNSMKAAPVPANYFSASMAKLQTSIRERLVNVMFCVEDTGSFSLPHTSSTNTHKSNGLNICNFSTVLTCSRSSGMSDGGNISEELLRSGRTCSRRQLVDGVLVDLASCSHSHP